MNHFIYCTPKGRLTIAADNQGITEIHFGVMELPMDYAPSALTNRAATEIQEYFAGKRTTFDIPLHPQGTPFQLEVWAELQNIPYGKTVTYADIAALLGKPKSYRAVGSANNKNPIPILIPCHRVIGANGSLTGYASGLKIKKYLLDLEARYVKQ